MRHVFANILFFIGIVSLFLGGYLMWQRTLPKNLSFSGTLPVVKQTLGKNKEPIEIRIPALSLDLPIIPSHITKGTWETTMQGVSYLASSPIPGSKGNSILYGHDFLNLLGKLPQAKPGEEIDIFYSDKTKKRFIIQYTSVVSSNQIDILYPSHDKRITIYTCYGLFETQRFVAVAKLHGSL